MSAESATQSKRGAVILDDNEVALAGADFDQPPSPLKRFVVIATTARSGSHLLSRLLKQLGYGVPFEYYNPLSRPRFVHRWGLNPAEPLFATEYLKAIIRHRTIDGFCVVKCTPNQFSALAAGIAAQNGLSALCFVHLWRRDSLAQAISLRLSQQSGVWDYTPGPTTRPHADLDVFDLDALHRVRRRAVVRELSWRLYLRNCNAPVVHVAYEDLVDDREQELRRLIAFLDPQRMLASPLSVSEPVSPEGLWARQHLSPAGRRALREAYEERFGVATPMSQA